MKIRIVKSFPKKSFAPVAKLIMFFQKTNYSHMSIHFKVGESSWLVADVTGNDGFKVNNLSKWEESHLPLESKLLEVSHEDFMMWMIKHLGVEYDKGQVFGLFLRAIGFISTNNIGFNYKKMVCNELVLSFLERFYNIEIGDPDNYDLNMTSRLLDGL